MTLYLEEQLNIIKNYYHSGLTHYFSPEGLVCYFGVVLRNGKIDVKKFPSGRCNSNEIDNDEFFICFKKVKKDNEVELYIREYLDESKMYNEDLELYLYLKEKCKFESYFGN
jgi:hypothetical protein